MAQKIIEQVRNVKKAQTSILNQQENLQFQQQEAFEKLNEILFVQERVKHKQLSQLKKRVYVEAQSVSNNIDQIDKVLNKLLLRLVSQEDLALVELLFHHFDQLIVPTTELVYIYHNYIKANLGESLDSLTISGQNSNKNEQDYGSDFFNRQKGKNSEPKFKQSQFESNKSQRAKDFQQRVSLTIQDQQDSIISQSECDPSSILPKNRKVRRSLRQSQQSLVCKTPRPNSPIRLLKDSERSKPGSSRGKRQFVLDVKLEEVIGIQKTKGDRQQDLPALVREYILQDRGKSLYLGSSFADLPSPVEEKQSLNKIFETMDRMDENQNFNEKRRKQEEQENQEIKIENSNKIEQISRVVKQDLDLRLETLEKEIFSQDVRSKVLSAGSNLDNHYFQKNDSGLVTSLNQGRNQDIKYDYRRSDGTMMAEIKEKEGAAISDIASNLIYDKVQLYPREEALNISLEDDAGPLKPKTPHYESPKQKATHMPIIKGAQNSKLKYIPKLPLDKEPEQKCKEDTKIDIPVGTNEFQFYELEELNTNSFRGLRRRNRSLVSLQKTKDVVCGEQQQTSQDQSKSNQFYTIDISSANGVVLTSSIKSIQQQTIENEDAKNLQIKTNCDQSQQNTHEKPIPSTTPKQLIAKTNQKNRFDKPHNRQRPATQHRSLEVNKIPAQAQDVNQKQAQKSSLQTLKSDPNFKSLDNYRTNMINNQKSPNSDFKVAFTNKRGIMVQQSQQKTENNIAESSSYNTIASTVFKQNYGNPQKSNQQNQQHTTAQGQKKPKVRFAVANSTQNNTILGGQNSNNVQNKIQSQQSVSTSALNSVNSQLVNANINQKQNQDKINKSFYVHQAQTGAHRQAFAGQKSYFNPSFVKPSVLHPRYNLGQSTSSGNNFQEQPKVQKSTNMHQQQQIQNSNQQLKQQQLNHKVQPQFGSSIAQNLIANKMYLQEVNQKNPQQSFIKPRSGSQSVQQLQYCVQVEQPKQAYTGKMNTSTTKAGQRQQQSATRNNQGSNKPVNSHAVLQKSNNLSNDHVNNSLNRVRSQVVLPRLNY